MYIYTMVGIRKRVIWKDGKWRSFIIQSIKQLKSSGELVDSRNLQRSKVPKDGEGNVCDRDAGSDYVHKFAECQEGDITVKYSAESADLS